MLNYQRVWHMEKKLWLYRLVTETLKALILVLER
jgi:hypothetical protein